MTEYNEPVAWAFREEYPEVGQSPIICWSLLQMKAFEKSLPRCTVIPLYRQPKPTFTSEEIEAIECAINACDETLRYDSAATLRNLLEEKRKYSHG